MKRTQYDMFCKMITTTGTATVKGITFTVAQRPNGTYQLLQTKKGQNVTLKTGTFEDCCFAAKDCIEMMYEIEG